MASNLLDNARVFYQLFRANKLTSQVDQEQAIPVLDEIAKSCRQAADSHNLAGSSRDGFLFFNGAYIGLLLLSKAYEVHLKSLASEQNVRLPKGTSNGVPSGIGDSRNAH